MSDQPKPTTNEWTADDVMMMFLSSDGGQGRASESYKAVADAINAALAEKNNREIDTICELQRQLSAERERADKNADVIEATALELGDVRQQLADSQTAGATLMRHNEQLRSQLAELQGPDAVGAKVKEKPR